MASPGKTVAGELAIYYALALGLRVFYTTPLKVGQYEGKERKGKRVGDGAVLTTITRRIATHRTNDERQALSNQKFSDFCRQFGPERVGLLTGDTNINRGAQVNESVDPT